jgi:hypothetical protein
LNSHATQAINSALQTKVYPLVRKAFADILPPEHEQPLFVYDALVIRYNVTKATAGQPLHRDLGLVSVNIMLNSPTEFQGGGTFFENQLLLSESAQPLKPIGVGHALLHQSSQRHAGAATLAGIRDILVVFITVPSAPKLTNARLKTTCRDYCDNACHSAQAALECRIRHYRLAVAMVPEDGEAEFLLGTTFMEYAFLLWNDEDITAATLYLQQAMDCFQTAAQFTPCDARVHNNWGITLERMESRVAMETTTTTPSALASFLDTTTPSKTTTAEHAYQRGRKLLEASAKAGCDVTGPFSTKLRVAIGQSGSVFGSTSSAGSDSNQVQQ